MAWLSRQSTPETTPSVVADLPHCRRRVVGVVAALWGIMVINNSHIAEFNATGATMAVATIPMFLCWVVFYTEAFRATRSIWSGSLPKFL